MWVGGGCCYDVFSPSHPSLASTFNFPHRAPSHPVKVGKQFRSTLNYFFSIFCAILILFSLPPPSAGHRRIHQEGVRQEVQPDMALHRRTQLRLIRHARDASLHLLLLGPSSHSVVQEWLSPSRSLSPPPAVQLTHTHTQTTLFRCCTFGRKSFQN